MKQKINFVCLLLCVPFVLGGCGVGKQNYDGSAGLNLTFMSSYVDDEAATAFGMDLVQQATGIKEEIEINPQSVGSADADPAMAMGGMIKIDAMIAAKELDVMICDREQAARYARSDSFIPMNELLSEQQMKDAGSRLIAYDMVDAEGEFTGQKSAAVGLDISSFEGLSEFMDDSDKAIFVVANTQNLDASRELLTYFLKE